MKYCIDSSALLDLGERHYPERLKLFAPIWDHFYGEVDNGNIVSVDFVQAELEQKAGDWRDAFLKRAGSMFAISSEIEAEYARLIAAIESNSRCPANRARDRFLAGADPWVIAMARTIGTCTAISAEQKNLSAYGIGALCTELGVRHINLVEFFEENNIGH